MKNSLDEMTCLDVYLSCLTEEEYEIVKPYIQNSDNKAMPIMSWDVHIENYHNKLIEAKKQNELEQVMTMANQFSWKNDLILNFLKMTTKL